MTKNIRTATFEETPKDNYNPPLVWDRGRNGVVILDAGNSDDIDISKYGNDYLILSINSGLGYIGAQLVNKDNETLNSFFAQNACEEIDPNVFDWSLSKLKNHIADYLI